MDITNIFVITGLSGSGKSTAMDAFEDAGYYCVDNMPIVLLPKFMDLPLEDKNKIKGFVFVMDLRALDFIKEHDVVFTSLIKKGYHFQLIYLEASEEILMQRYSQTRRQHPMEQGGTGVIEAIQTEQELLKPIKSIAQIVIDTSSYNVHQLKSVIRDIAYKATQEIPLKIYIRSFGYKYGTPRDADILFDVRCLSNPYFIPELRPFTGKTEAVRKYVLKNEQAVLLLNKLFDLLEYAIPLYEKEGKAYLNISIGCTGGRHRSVAVSESLFQKLCMHWDRVKISHRDIDKE